VQSGLLMAMLPGSPAHSMDDKELSECSQALTKVYQRRAIQT
jgi:hypothetical protein